MFYSLSISYYHSAACAGTDAEGATWCDSF
jgi:hypothetical protein